MNNVFLHLSTILILAVAVPAQAMTCGQFNALGVTANTLDQVAKTPATSAQITEYKKVIADHVADLSGFGFSAKKRALQLARKNNQLTMLVRESLAITRVFCFDRPNESMQEVAIEQFDFLLNAIAKKHNL